VAATLHPPTSFRNPGGFDYAAHLRRGGILLTGSARAERVAPLTGDTPSWPVAVRRWATGAIASALPEGSAALLAGLLLGERAGLPREIDDAFRRAGTYHVLAVSGFNVALVGSSALALLALLGAPRRAALLAAGGALAGFALVVGGQPSVLRATLMGLLLVAAALIERESRLGNALALAALALLVVHPGDLWDPGFQLSFAATAGIVYLTRPAAAWLGERGVRRPVALALGVSVAAQAGVLPVMLAHFNQLSLVGPAANLAVVPLAGLATLLGMLALAATAVSEGAASLVWPALWLVLLGLRAAVWLAARIPGAMVHLPAPGPAAVLAWYLALALVPHARARRGARAAAVALLAAAVGLAAWPWLRPGDGRLRVTVLDVGQGDAILVEAPDGPRLLVDAGAGGPRRFDVGARVVAPFLWNRPVAALDAVAVSHGDADHAGGIPAVLGHFRVGEVWETGRWPEGTAGARAAIERSGVRRRQLAAGQRLWLGEVLITVLGPEPGPPAQRINDESLVLRLDWRGFAMLLAGDIGAGGEAGLADRGAPLRAHVLKVAHHGSRSSTSAGFLEAVRPRVALVSAGRRNPFGHPSPAVLARLAGAGARVYRTDRDGAIVLETDGATLHVTRWAGRRVDAIPLEPEDTAAPGGIPEGREWDAREREGGSTPRGCARTARAAAPAPPDRDACPGRAPSLPGWS
jgi:competence protein ComEC